MNQSQEIPDTRTRLLDTAERLFGEHGFNGVGLRTISEDAEVNLGAATYHFGTKENLYKEAFLRRFVPTCERRLQLLTAAKEAAGSESLPAEKILDCMLRPIFDTIYSHPHFFKFMSHNLFWPSPFMQQVVEKEHGHAFQPFVDSFRALYPNLSNEIIMRQMKYCAGALFFSVGRTLDAYTNLSEEQVKERVDHLLRFCAAGFEEMA